MFKKNLLTGLLVLIPLVLTGWVLFSLVEFLDQAVLFLPDHLRPEYFIGSDIFGFGLILTAVVIFVIGIIANNFFGKKFLKKLQKEGKSTKVDLFYSGRMLGALTPGGRTIRKTGTNKVSVNLRKSQMRQRAVFNQVLGKNKREFFGFNDRTANIIRKQFNRFVAKEFRKARI